MARKLTGSEYKAIREHCGYSAEEVGRYHKEHGLSATSARSIYRLEDRDDVPLRYVEALRKLVGRENFSISLRDIRLSVPLDNNPSTLGYSARDVARLNRKVAELDDDPQTIQEDRFLQFLNALPIDGNIDTWLTSFKKSLLELFTDVDRVVININRSCNLDHPEQSQSTGFITEHTNDEESAIVVTTDDEAAMKPADRLLSSFRERGYPLDDYRPPFAIDCYIHDVAYIGTIFFLRKKESPPFSPHTVRVLHTIQPFLCFALSYIVSRNRHIRPQDESWTVSLNTMVVSAGLSPQERRVVVLLLYGYKYHQVAKQLNMSKDTVRKHVTSIHRKTSTHSGSELFAKYFTPRLYF